MENENELFRAGGHMPVVSPFPFLPAASSSFSDSSAVEPKSGPEGVNHHHRRSASDTYAYLGEVKRAKHESEIISNLVVEQIREETSLEKLEGMADRANGSQVKSSASKPDVKRTKQHNAHRSRVLQYISHLERTVQILQIEGTEASAELDFLVQQNIILSMENRALKQLLENLSQDQMINHWEPQPHYPRQRRNRSRALDHQVISYPINNKDPGSDNGSARI